jgi:hypothetical protein
MTISRVTGTFGFLGSNLTHTLLRSGKDAISGRRRPLYQSHPGRRAADRRIRSRLTPEVRQIATEVHPRIRLRWAQRRDYRGRYEASDRVPATDIARALAPNTGYLSHPQTDPDPATSGPRSDTAFGAGHALIPLPGRSSYGLKHRFPVCGSAAPA